MEVFHIGEIKLLIPQICQSTRSDDNSESAIEKLSNKNQKEQMFSTKKEWCGEVDPNHFGIVDAAKVVHCRFKEVELSGAFSGSGPFGKGNDSTEQLLWTNVCLLIIKKKENVFHPGFDKDILALALNMCQILEM